jgi:sugar phosphate isomerase/epimerase
MRTSTNLHSIVLAAFLAIFVFGNLSAKTPTAKHKQIGIQLWSVRDDMQKDPVGTIEKLGKMGYKLVEAAGYSDGKFYGMTPAEFKALCNKNGLNFFSSHTGHPVPTKENWDETMKWWDTCIAAHKAAGVKYIVQPSMDKVGYESIEGIQRYCDYFNAVGEKCNKNGIRFGYHNHNAEFTTVHNGQTVYDYMLTHTDPKKVMFQLDLYWIAQGGKNAVDYFNKYPKRFELWHIKDEKELGASGTMDFKTPFANAAKAGMKNYIVEVERYDFEPLVSVQKSLEFLQNADYVK